MSGKNNVNPDYYKTSGRDRVGDDLLPQPAARGASAPPRPRGKKRPAPANFIPGEAPVGEVLASPRVPRAAPRRGEMDQGLKGKKIAILVTDGFEQSEMTEPRKALDHAGATTELVSPAAGKVKGWIHGQWADEFPVDVPLDQAQAGRYDALVLPGGVMNPDRLRMNEGAVAFVRGFVDAHKPIAAICHGPWTLIDAGGVRGRRLTSWPSLKTDLRNAGAEWVDEEVVVDQGLVTSRKPADIPAFNAKMIEEFREGAHTGRRAA